MARGSKYVHMHISSYFLCLISLIVIWFFHLRSRPTHGRLYLGINRFFAQNHSSNGTLVMACSGEKVSVIWALAWAIEDSSWLNQFQITFRPLLININEAICKCNEVAILLYSIKYQERNDGDCSRKNSSTSIQTINPQFNLFISFDLILKETHDLTQIGYRTPTWFVSNEFIWQS